jgi:hypothetical protein
VFALGQISNPKMGYAFLTTLDSKQLKISRWITASSIPAMDRFRAPQREWV